MNDTAELTPGGAEAMPKEPLLRRWVALWDEREAPHLLAVIRIALSLVLLLDLATIGSSGLAEWLWAPDTASGIALLDDANKPIYYRLLPSAPASATLLWLGLVASISAVLFGFFTRSAALVFVALSVQAASINPLADRAVDEVSRLVLLILACSAAGKVWSIDAKLGTGHFAGDDRPAPAWPRYLILGQLVLVYAAAGWSKGGTRWFPWGGYGALYLILQDPAYAGHDFGWLGRPLAFFFTQLGTAATHTWESAAPLVLVAAHCRRRAERPGQLGRLARLINRVPVRNTYVCMGVAFHLLLAVTMRLGIFPYAMLALFPAFFRPADKRGTP